MSKEIIKLIAETIRRHCAREKTLSITQCEVIAEELIEKMNGIIEQDKTTKELEQN